MNLLIGRNGQTFGPYPIDQVQTMVAGGQLVNTDLAWFEGAAAWMPLPTVLGMRQSGIGMMTPPPSPMMVESDRMGDHMGMRMLLPVGRSGWAIAAGYLGLFAVLAVPAPFALLTSILAIREIRRSRNSPKKLHGMGRAVFGLIMGILGTLFLGFILYGIFVAQKH